MSREGRPVVAIVPAYNRADTVGATVTALGGVDGVDGVLVVDDGSTDATAVAAAEAGAGVVRLPVNTGKGGAVAAGVAATPFAATYLLVDADVGVSARATGALLAPVLAGEADLTVGVLPGAGARGGFGLVRRLAGAGIERATGFRSAAPLSGQRAVRADLLRELDLAPRFGLEVGLTVDALRAGSRVLEVPVTMDHRHTGRTMWGFLHRARQGSDALRALWPRLVPPRRRRQVIAAGLVAVLAAVALGAAARAGAPGTAIGTEPGRVLVIGLPGLSWEELGTGRMPNLDRLLGAGALGAMNVRTLSDRPTSVEGYATLGAGARVAAGTAAARARGSGPVVVDRAAAIRDDAGDHLPSLPGALGDALHGAGLRTAVVGTAATAPGLAGVDELELVRRPAAVALMDAAGIVDAGTVEPDELLMPAPRTPFGRRADPERVLAETRAALAGAAVVLVDPGDLDRAHALSDVAAPDAFVAAARDRALRDADDLLGRLVEAAPADTLVLVVAVRPRGDEWRLTPVVAAGPGVPPGGLSSPSTRRAGLVTLTDVAPTILDALGTDVPGGMVGSPFRYGAGPTDAAALADLDRRAAFRERLFAPATLGLVALQGLAYALVLLARRRGGLLAAARTALLAVAAAPLAALLFGAVPGLHHLGLWALVVLGLLDAGVVLVAGRASRYRLSPLAWILGATALVIVADVATGARLQLGGLLGYAPQSASRFYGLGNSAFAVLGASAVLAVALHVHHAPRRADAVVTAGGVLLLVAAVDGLPGLGDDVGGLLVLPPVFLLVGFGLARRRLTARLVAGALLAGTAVLAAAAAVDLSRPPEARSHLGRLLGRLGDGDGGLGAAVARKLDASLGVIEAAPWLALAPVIAAVLLYAVARRGAWRAAPPPGSALRTGVLGALAVGLVGGALNDSGAVVAAMVLVAVGPVLALLALPAPRRAPVLLAPVPLTALALSPGRNGSGQGPPS